MSLSEKSAELFMRLRIIDHYSDVLISVLLCVSVTLWVITRLDLPRSHRDTGSTEIRHLGLDSLLRYTRNDLNNGRADQITTEGSASRWEFA